MFVLLQLPSLSLVLQPLPELTYLKEEDGSKSTSQS